MARSVLVVETRPKDPARLAEYHRWYDEVHLAEVVEAGGFVSARRYDPIDPAEPFVAVFEFDEDLDVVQQRVANARRDRSITESQAEIVSVRYYRERCSYSPPDGARDQGLMSVRGTS